MARAVALLLMIAGASVAQPAPTLYRTHASPFDVAYGRFGTALATLGDVDGDGTPDLAIGATREGDGRVHVFSGATGASLYRVWPTGLCDEFGCSFGAAIAAVPDTDGDGAPDLAVGSPGERVGGREFAGAVYLFSGATGAPRWRLGNPSPTFNAEAFGDEVAPAGDADGDGVWDVIGGTGGDDRLHVVSGATGAIVRSETGTGTFGLTFVGDTDEDGAPEVAVSAILKQGGEQTGAFLYDAAAGAYRDTVAAPPEAIGSFGQQMSPAGDVDGDGAADFVVGAPDAGRAPPVLGPGAAYVYSGAPGALVHALQSPTPQSGTVGGRFGWSVAAGTDVNGDGVGDVAIGAPSEDGIASRDGQVHVFSGATGALLHTLVNPDTPQNNAQFGWSVAFTRTADDHPALAVGVPDVGLFLGSPDGAGRVYVFAFGDSTVGTSPGPSGGGLAVSVWPNPSAGAASVVLTIPSAQAVRVAVTDALGREVAVLHDGPLGAGRHRLALPTGSAGSGSGLAPGVYAVRASSPAGDATARWVIAR